MQYIEAWREILPLSYYAYALILGLSVGSFLNVLIYRLPRRMEAALAREIKYEVSLVDERLSNKLPKPDLSHTKLGGRSYCPACKKKIPIWNNIPILSYLLLRGKSACCSTSISVRYIFIEAVSGGMTLAAFVYLPPAVALWASLGAWLSIVLVACDFRSLYLPDELVFTLWLTGIVGAYVGISPISLEKSIFFSCTGFLFLYFVANIYREIRGKNGLGGGDSKLLGALGAWAGTIQPILILACIFTVGIWALSKQSNKEQIPYAPGLVLGGIIMFILLLLEQHNLFISGILYR